MACNASTGIEPVDHIEEFTRFVKHTIPTGHTSDGPRTLKAWLDLAEAYRITQALRECHGNRSAAARLLGIGRRTLYAKMEKLGITATWRVSERPTSRPRGTAAAPPPLEISREPGKPVVGEKRSPEREKKP